MTGLKIAIFGIRIHEVDRAVGDGGGDTFRGGSWDFPECLAGDGIETGDEVAAGEEELGSSGCSEDDW